MGGGGDLRGDPKGGGKGKGGVIWGGDPKMGLTL